MCDYSLMTVPNRLAREGEKLIFHRFPTGSMGLASQSDFDPVSKSRAAETRNILGYREEIFRCATVAMRHCSLHPAGG